MIVCQDDRVLTLFLYAITSTRDSLCWFGTEDGWITIGLREWERWRFTIVRVCLLFGWSGFPRIIDLPYTAIPAVTPRTHSPAIISRAISPLTIPNVAYLKVSPYTA